MRHSALIVALSAQMMVFAMLSPQTAIAFSVPATQCTNPAMIQVEPAREPVSGTSSLANIRMQQEISAAFAQPEIDYAIVASSFTSAPCFKKTVVSIAIFSTPVALPFEQPLTVTDRPDVFGSTAIPVSHTPLDAKWHRAENSKLSARSGPWISLIRTVAVKDRTEQLRAINQWVNARVRFTDDRPHKNGADGWSDASETLLNRQGDCEDYAIAKMKLLEAAGVTRDDIYLVIARDLVRRADHALLIVRLNQQLMVLDSGSDEIIDARYVQDYRPIFSYGLHGAWVHGYAEILPVQIASATDPT
jgi:predicted transglutaminase-like cysteine proteinase